MSNSGSGGSNEFCNMKRDLLSMGFEEEAVILAVRHTETIGGTIEDAMGMILTPELYTTDVQPSFTHPPPIAEACKLVLIVRTDLRMSTGKVAAQCVHAALGVLEVDASPEHDSTIQFWKREGEATICLRCADEAQMLELQATAQTQGLPAHLVQDGSRTVLAIGPAAISRVDSVTGHLKLL